MDSLHLCFIIFCVSFVKCNITDTNCNITYTDEFGGIINVTTYCRNKKCIVKCCQPGYVIGFIKKCDRSTRYKFMKKKFSVETVYAERNGNRTDVAASLTEFSLVYIKTFEIECFENFDSSYYLQKDGVLKKKNNAYEELSDVSTWDYCTDVEMILIKDGKSKIKKAEITYREAKYKNPNGEAEKSQALFTAASMLISTFFLFLVWLIYIMLASELNLHIHKATRAIVFTLGSDYLLKSITILYVKHFTVFVCQLITPPMYFAFLSSFFWTNLVSLKVYRSFRNPYIVLQDRQKEKVKFRWHCAYAYGVPLLITVVATIVDNLPLRLNCVRPAFNLCFQNREGTLYYLQIPVIALTIVNLILYLITVYVIYTETRKSYKFFKNNQTKGNRNIFLHNTKLSFVMGISWILELVDCLAPNTSTWLFICVNGCNTLIGVVIFFLFAFKMSFLISICKKFGIKAGFVEKFEAKRDQSYSWTSGSKINRSQKSLPGSADVENATIIEA